ncbi:MAG: fibronectin type III domain-containing protein, partial [Elusimicrobia bacterium]|nr:fibronectin type III domain-containing protein [Elusimicrobiota bacterium]
MIFPGGKRFAVFWLLITAGALVSPRGAAAAVCAEVRLEIKQEATLEREAFDARLEVNNNFPAFGLENFRVNVVVKNASGQTADDLFFIKISSKQGVGAVDGTGIVQPASTATINWLIIPSTGAGGVNPLGLRYSVKADISYKLNGVYQSLSTYEDFITVKPQPVLRLEYVLPFEVFADEPLTDTIEPVEPFPLGVRITNIGYGPAKNFQINSGQPEIIENKQGLAIDFKLLGAYVGANKIPDTLLIPFGDIASGGVSQASWIMATSLSGRFTQFKATFTHTAELGGQLTSLIKDVTTYTLIKDVLVDLPGRDSHFDFLVNTTTPRTAMETILNGGGEILPDLILESDQPLPIAVYHAVSELSGTPTAADPMRTLKITEEVAPGPWLHISAPVPDSAVLAAVKRSDGKTLNSANAWISRYFNKSNISYSYRLNVLDYNVPKLAEYKAEFSLRSVDQAPGPVTLSAEPAGSGAILLTWAAPGEDGNTGDMIGGRYLIQAEREAGAAFNPSNAQVNITTNTKPGTMQNYVVSLLAGNTDYYLKLWTQDTSGNISPASNMAQAYAMPNPPKDPIFSEISSSSVKLAWAIGNNWLPINYQVFADTDAAIPYGFASALFDFTVTSHVFTGLAPNTTYFFFGRAVNPETLAVSGDTAFGAALTLAALPESPVFKDITPSSFTLAWSGGGNPAGTEYLIEISTNISGSPVATSSGWVAQTDYAFSGLTPDTTYYARAKARNYSGVETAFVDLGVLRTKPLDSLPPATNIAFSAPNFGTEPVYISSKTEITLTAYDDAAVIGDRMGGGVAVTYYSVDSDTFSVYSGSFSITAEGAHVVKYYSADTAGNIEAVKLSSVTVDDSPPMALLAITGPLYQFNGVDYVSGLSTVTLKASDAYSGVKELYYEINGSTYSVLADSRTLTLPEGMYTIAYRASDNLGNISEPRLSSVTVDNTPPLTGFEVIGSSLVIDGNMYVIGGSSVSLLPADAISGLKGLYYSFDGSTAAASQPVYLLPGPGPHTLAFYAVDNVDNQESEHVLEFFVGAMPKTMIWSGLAGDGDWYNPGNWRENMIPGVDDNAVLSTRDTVFVSSCFPVLKVRNLVLGDVEGLSAPIMIVSTGVISPGKWTISKNAILIQNTLEPFKINNFSLLAGGKMEHTANGSEKKSIINLDIAGDFTMERGSTINVAGLGYGPRQGPGSPIGCTGGAGYGGNGGSSYCSGGGGSSYGSIVNPVDIGSGGN